MAWLQDISFIVAATWFVYQVCTILYNLYFHPLAKYPGPRGAAITKLWKSWYECVLQRSLTHELVNLHKIYGDIVRIGPNELHFAAPEAYHEIYNNLNRWRKEETLYHSFGANESSFGFLDYRPAKERRNVLSKMFAPKAIHEDIQPLVVEKIHALFSVLERRAKEGKSSNMFLACRCLTMDIITYLCFGRSVNSIDEPDFHAPLIESVDTSVFTPVYMKHSALYRWIIANVPRKLAMIVAPGSAALLVMQQRLERQIAAHVKDPASLSHLPHSTTIYHLLLNPEAYRTKTVPSTQSLYAESQAMIFAGSDTGANVMMLGLFYLMKNPKCMASLKQELREFWPNINDEPDLKAVEKLPYLNAFIKESLRMGPNIPSGCPRIVPAGGFNINGHHIPGGTCVSMSQWLIHRNPTLFEDPDEFIPERWLQSDSAALEKWLVPFSRGPRMCLGMNLAWCEMRLGFAYMIRKFNLEMDPAGPQTDHLPWHDVFLPYFPEPHVKAFMESVPA
ncbi:MAG: hypothetical protein M1834_007440 [Cirrosporium novae-zelandiae]|nr:MAG: hypothetical protein M1834_007440 [Cirrosporium novae-zelandiae]